MNTENHSQKAACLWSTADLLSSADQQLFNVSPLSLGGGFNQMIEALSA